MAKKQEEVRTCDHVRPNGSCCESPSLRDDNYCYFHRAQRERTRRRLRLARQQKPLELPSLEDRESIHLALTEVLSALVADRIDPKKAGLLLYGLQTAVLTIDRCDFRTHEYQTRMLRYTDNEHRTLEEEIDQEIKLEQAAERRAAKRAARKAESPTSVEVPGSEVCDVPDVEEVTGCPTAGEVPDVGVSDVPDQGDVPHDLPEKKPAAGVSKETFWGVVGAMATQNARECALEARRLLDAADHAEEQEKAYKTATS